MVLSRILQSLGGGSSSNSTISDDSTTTDKNLKLPFRLKKGSPTTPAVQLYPFAPDNDPEGLIVKIEPPQKPSKRLHHVPCDLVLCIDVSGSMQCEAPMPVQADGAAQEDSGLSVLDLVKHAARTILETLDHQDRLGIITFSSRTEVLQPLTSMNALNKAATLKKIKGMEPQDMTNLWHGIRDGLELFKGAKGETGRVPALLVLTDGMPNHMCPQQGYVPKLQAMEPLPATIHTFGFGYSLKSGLLKSIAEVGGGNYSFIPDAGMIGTVFVHATANLQSTYANNGKLCLTYPSYLKLEETTGAAVDKQAPVALEGADQESGMTSLTILLGNLQYGQSRDIYLRYGASRKVILAASETEPPVVTATLSYQRFTAETHRITTERSTIDFAEPSLPPAEIAYHVSRSALVSFLSNFTPLNATLEHVPLKQLPEDLAIQLQSLHASLPAARPEFASHPGCQSLLEDLCGSGTTPTNPNPNPRPRSIQTIATVTTTTTTTTTSTIDTPATSEADTDTSASTTFDDPNPDNDPSSWTGQIALALLTPTYYHRWGVHYLPSLAGAHARQVCNSFKDAGPLRYGADSPLFQKCKQRLDDAFDGLPAPEPSIAAPQGGTYMPVSMGTYNNVGNGCFAGCVMVELAGGKGAVRVGRLRKGMEVRTPRGGRRVVGVLSMPVVRGEMCLVGEGGLLVTPWHPVALSEGGSAGWVFPKDVAARKVRYTGVVYTVLLERDEDVDAHAIRVGGVWGVTMGHGMTEAGKSRDVRAHQFYGDYEKVSRALARLPRRAHGVKMGGGLTRDPETGLVNGFSQVDERRAKVLLRRQRKRAVSA